MMNSWRYREITELTDRMFRSANNNLYILHESLPFLPKQVRCLKDLIKVNQKIKSYLKPYTTDKGIDITTSSMVAICTFCLMDLIRLARMLDILVLIPTGLIIELVQVLTATIELIQASTISRDLLHRLQLSIQTLSIRILTATKTIQSF